jgi:hypothetical protein
VPCGPARHPSDIHRAGTHHRPSPADGHRELARQLFADMPAEEFDGFDACLSHVLNRLRTLLAKSP